jgi:putative tryptophan/tyrosine transport system substrate-binding protein
MRRRSLLMLLGGTAVWAIPALAQHRQMPVIGYLSPESPEPFASRVAAFREGLAETGYVEDRNVAIEFRWAEGQYDRLPALATDLVDRRVDVIVAPGGAPVALAAKSATETIPIVFEMGGDPVALGVVNSLSRPGGNLTGVSSLNVEVSRKRLEFMHEVSPSATLFAVVVNPTSPTARSQLNSLQTAAAALGVQLQVLNASTEQEFDTAFEAVRQLQAGGLVFSSDPYFANRSRQLAALAARHAVAGGLMSYGGDFTQSHRLAGVYTGRVLKGEKTSDLPVQLVTKLELFVNAKTAAGLGINLPPELVANADVVIE